MNEKDKADARKLIESIFRNPGWSNDQLVEAINDLLATARKETREAAFTLTSNEAEDLRETLTNAADDLNTEGLGDTDSCIFARRWAKRLEKAKGKK